MAGVSDSENAATCAQPGEKALAEALAKIAAEADHEIHDTVPEEHREYVIAVHGAALATSTAIYYSLQCRLDYPLKTHPPVHTRRPARAEDGAECRFHRKRKKVCG